MTICCFCLASSSSCTPCVMLPRSWSVVGGSVDFDMHGARMDGGNEESSYWKGEAAVSGHGSFRPPFAGQHGWFWQNTTGNPFRSRSRPAAFTPRSNASPTSRDPQDPVDSRRRGPRDNGVPQQLTGDRPKRKPQDGNFGHAGRCDYRIADDWHPRQNQCGCTVLGHEPSGARLA